jgi:acyl-CoA thioesterase-2
MPAAMTFDPVADAAAVQAVAELVDALRLEALEHNLFRGRSLDMGGTNVFGGQVLGQALMAAGRTAEGQPVHSLHGYFLRGGDKAAPIVYEVDRIRDGKSFITRRVVAIQHGQAIFHMAASFHRPEEGPAIHQGTMPEAPAPEGLVNDHLWQRRHIDQLPARQQAWLRSTPAVDLRTADPLDLFAPERRPAQMLHWLRAAAPLPDDPLVHHALLAYASDWSLMRVAMLPHGLSWNQPGVQGVSLDHAMWFHRDFRFDEWLLYEKDSPSLSDARGFCRGALWTRDGRLVASVAQEGLIRMRHDAPT